MTNKANPYTYVGLTVSICPTCHTTVPASIKEKDNKIFMSKSCPEHGRFKSIIASDARWYHDAQRQTAPSLMLKKYQTETEKGCPHDCGVCPEHEQNNALPVIEITNVCNLDCPICFADNHHDYMMSDEEMERCLDILEASGTDVSALILTGGEPTAHPRLIEFIEMAQRRPNIPRVAIATNGILLAKKESLVKRLAEVNAYVLFQLDSVDASKNKVLRGNEMTRYREQALENLEKHNVQTTILMTVITGLNDDEIGSLFKFSLSKPFICGFEAQTMSYTGAGGRGVKFDPMTRVTGTDLIHQIDAQSGGIVTMKDFIPMPHPHPNCVAITYMLMLNDGSAMPFLRFTEKDLYLDAIRNEFLVKPTERHEAMLKRMIEHVFANEAEIERGSAVLDTLKTMLGDLYPVDREVTPEYRIQAVQKYVKNVFLHNYMDDHSFDAAVLRKCTSMQVVPDGRMIPNCGYRVIHRKSDPRWQKSKHNPGHGNDGLRRQLTILS
ncbi:MAG TPA: radical SAM protein [Polyangiaceae bacterium]|nr:radical SAM protein [Polyangiaceae bacterium]